MKWCLFYDGIKKEVMDIEVLGRLEREVDIRDGLMELMK